MIGWLVTTVTDTAPIASSVVKPDFLRMILCAKSLWKTVVAVLSDIARDNRPTANLSRVYHAIVPIINTALCSREKAPSECVDFLRALAQDGLIDALDEALPRHDSTPKQHGMLYTVIFPNKSRVSSLMYSAPGWD